MKKYFITHSAVSFLFLSLIFVFTPHTAQADVSGRWVCHFDLSGSGDYPQDMLLTNSNGTISGTEVYPGTDSVFANVAGTISGASINIRADYTGQNYFALIAGTVSGTSMTGSWHNDHQTGGFSCTQTTFTGPAPTPTTVPTDPTQSGKRATAISLFCNRTGVGLSTADCAVTVGDAGAPPRSAPTGVVNFTATNGFFPSSASCNVQQTPYSPGVVSCKAEFSVPLNFPLGIAFPIDATYVGDTVFAGATTSHATIQAGCVGDAEHPCSGAVALTFANIPQVLKNAITTIFECGSTTVKKSFAVRGLGSSIAKCVGQIQIDAPISKILAEMDFSQLLSLAGKISNADAKSDPLLQAVQSLDDAKYYTQVQNALNDQAKLNKLMVKILEDKSKAQQNAINQMRSFEPSARAQRTVVLTLGTAAIDVKSNARKAIKVRLTKTAAKLTKALKAAGKGDINATMKMKGQRSTGAKKAFNKSFAVNLGLN